MIEHVIIAGDHVQATQKLYALKATGVDPLTVFISSESAILEGLLIHPDAEIHRVGGWYLRHDLGDIVRLIERSQLKTRPLEAG